MFWVGWFGLKIWGGVFVGLFLARPCWDWLLAISFCLLGKKDICRDPLAGKLCQVLNYFVRLVLKLFYIFAAMPRIKYIDITPTAYAAMYGCALNVITYRIRQSLPLPHVKEVKKFGRFYLFSVPESLTAIDFQD